jgi:MSHA biogenesis protein MshJ
MVKSWQDLIEKIDARVLRERALIFLCLLGFVYLVWHLLIATHFAQKQRLLNTELAALTTEQQQTKMQIDTLRMAAASELFLGKKADVVALQHQLDAVDQRLAGLSQGLIGADQLPKVLEDMLLQSAQLTLLKVQTLPTSELTLSTTTTDANGKPTAQVKGTGVFKHALVLEVSGGYLELIKLLSAIEALPWKFYWESLDYQVLSYPDAHIELRVFTLSSEEGLLGV